MISKEEYLPYHIVAGSKRFKCFLPIKKTEEEEEKENKEQTDEISKEQAKEAISTLFKNCYYSMKLILFS